MLKHHVEGLAVGFVNGKKRLGQGFFFFTPPPVQEVLLSLCLDSCNCRDVSFKAEQFFLDIDSMPGWLFSMNAC